VCIIYIGMQKNLNGRQGATREAPLMPVGLL
jgi:hypothetical protein